MENIDFEIKNGVLHGSYPDGIELDFEKSKQMVLDRIKYLNGQKLPILVDTTGVKQISKEARDFMATSKAREGVVAAALLSRSKFSMFMTNFFMKVSLVESPIPIKMFSKENEALDWLEQFKCL